MSDEGLREWAGKIAQAHIGEAVLRLFGERDEARREARDALTTINRLAGMLEAAARPKVLYHSGKMTRAEIEKVMAADSGNMIRVDGDHYDGTAGRASVHPIRSQVEAPPFDGTYPTEGPRTAVLSKETRGDGNKGGGS